jgi:hypothetical protein
VPSSTKPTDQPQWQLQLTRGVCKQLGQRRVHEQRVDDATHPRPIGDRHSKHTDQLGGQIGGWQLSLGAASLVSASETMESSFSSGR